MAYGDEQARAAFIPSLMSTFGNAQQLQQQQGQMQQQEEQNKLMQIKIQQQQREHQRMSTPKSLDEFLATKGLDPKSDTYQFFKDNLEPLAKDGMVTGYDLQNFHQYVISLNRK